MTFQPIKNRQRAKQLISFEGMELGERVWPTDFDAVIEWKGRAWLLFEVKHGSKPMPYGQRLALERFVADCASGGKQAIAVVVEHEVDDADKDIRLAECSVREVFPQGELKWRPPKRRMNAKEAMVDYIGYVDGRKGDMDEELVKYRSEQAHAYLERIRRMGDDCAALQAEVDDARERASGLTGIDYTRDQVDTTATDDAMVNAVESIKHAVRDYALKLAEYVEERKRASDAMMGMDDFTEARALRLRYLLGHKWELVCTEMDYSWDGMMKLRRRALCSYWEVMPHTERDPRPLARPPEYD